MMLTPIIPGQDNKGNKGDGPSHGKTCPFCGRTKKLLEFTKSNSWLHTDGLSPICNQCIKERLDEVKEEELWVKVDELCRYLDLPFIPKKFDEIYKKYGTSAFGFYARLFSDSEYAGLNWKIYNEAYLELQKSGLLEMEVPGLNEQEIQKMKVKWGFEYNTKELMRLNRLYEDLLKKQNVTGGIGEDVAQKLCVMSMLIDDSLAVGGEGVDKLINAYEKLVKIGNFTPKENMNEGDLGSLGEVTAWLERRGWQNKWYDGQNRDIIDEVLASMKTFTQRLYTNESGLGDEIDERINQLMLIDEMENGHKRDEDKMENPEELFILEEPEMLTDEEMEINLDALDSDLHY